jgi:hypothetical protein
MGRVKSCRKRTPRTAERAEKLCVMAIDKTIRPKLRYRKNTTFDRKQM